MTHGITIAGVTHPIITGGTGLITMDGTGLIIITDIMVVITAATITDTGMDITAAVTTTAIPIILIILTEAEEACHKLPHHVHQGQIPWQAAAAEPLCHHQMVQ